MKYIIILLVLVTWSSVVVAVEMLYLSTLQRGGAPATYCCRVVRAHASKTISRQFKAETTGGRGGGDGTSS